MTVNKFQTEWIVAHLLFPNSAQAREIYLFIISQNIYKNSSDDIAEKNKSIFKIAAEVFRKTHVIQSGQSFSEFNQSEFKHWPKFYKKLSKDEILLLVAVVFLDLKMSDIAIVFKVNSKQLENKFNQILGKLISKPQSALNMQYEFKFRSVHDQQKSDFIFYDNILQSVFGLGSISDEQIQKDLAENNRLHLRKYYESVTDFKSEMARIKKHTYMILEPQIQAAIETQSHFSGFKKLTVFLPTSFITVSILLLLFFRPQFIQETFSAGKNETIEIQQIKIDRHVENKDVQSAEPEQAAQGAVAAADVKPSTESVTVGSKNKKIVAANSLPVPAPVPSVPPTAKPALPTATQPIAVTAAVPLSEKIKPNLSATGGVFRGKLVVTDLQQVVGVIREKIINSGGKKAGEVELGWMKNESTSYFHFSYPEENKADLENYLKQFGKVQLTFEPHPRVMPKGIKRYIIEIKQNE